MAKPSAPAADTTDAAAPEVIPPSPSISMTQEQLAALVSGAVKSAVSEALGSAKSGPSADELQALRDELDAKLADYNANVRAALAGQQSADGAVTPYESTKRDLMLDVLASAVKSGMLISDKRESKDGKLIDSGTLEALMTGKSVNMKGPWTLAAARAAMDYIGSHDGEAAHQEANGRPMTVNGWPCTYHHGHRVCIRHVIERDGKLSFDIARRLDGGEVGGGV